MFPDAVEENRREEHENNKLLRNGLVPKRGPHNFVDKRRPISFNEPEEEESESEEILSPGPLDTPVIMKEKKSDFAKEAENVAAVMTPGYVPEDEESKAMKERISSITKDWGMGNIDEMDLDNIDALDFPEIDLEPKVPTFFSASYFVEDVIGRKLRVTNQDLLAGNESDDGGSSSESDSTDSVSDSEDSKPNPPKSHSHKRIAALSQNHQVEGRNNHNNNHSRHSVEGERGGMLEEFAPSPEGQLDRVLGGFIPESDDENSEHDELFNKPIDGIQDMSSKLDYTNGVGGGSSDLLSDLNNHPSNNDGDRLDGDDTEDEYSQDDDLAILDEDDSSIEGESHNHNNNNKRNNNNKHQMSARMTNILKSHKHNKQHMKSDPTRM
eukprot:UN01981